MNRKKILVQTCCAACSSYVFGQLQKNGLDPVAHFYSPHLKDEEEYNLRLNDLQKLCANEQIELIIKPFDPDKFSETLSPYKDRSSIKHISDKDRYKRKRCELCNRLSLESTVALTRKKRLKYFTTTDLCSPYKDHGLIVELANLYALEYNVVFYYQDFRKGYWNGRNYARTRGIYASSYCGCLESLSEGRLE
ncbi:MAG TPA: epoxyqueuosine reductase QueH [bacterium]|nr:epoxyqueuosine reductase QueH [bacterium]